MTRFSDESCGGPPSLATPRACAQDGLAFPPPPTEAPFSDVAPRAGRRRLPPREAVHPAAAARSRRSWTRWAAARLAARRQQRLPCRQQARRSRQGLGEWRPRGRRWGGRPRGRPRRPRTRRRARAATVLSTMAPHPAASTVGVSACGASTLLVAMHVLSVCFGSGECGCMRQRRRL